MVISQSIEQGNDGQVVQIVEHLLDLAPEQKTERVTLLLALGQRYAALAKAYGFPQPDQGEAASPFALAEKKQAWYRESIAVLTSALEQANDSLLCTQVMEALATSLIGLGQTLLAFYDALLDTCSQTLHLAQPESEAMRGLCWRALMLLVQGQEEAARAELQRLLMIIHPGEH